MKVLKAKGKFILIDEDSEPGEPLKNVEAVRIPFGKDDYLDVEFNGAGGLTLTPSDGVAMASSNGDRGDAIEISIIA